MFNNMNKKELAGMIAGGLGVAAGLGLALYTKIKCDKELKEMENIMKTVSDCTEEINELLEATGAIED